MLARDDGLGHALTKGSQSLVHITGGDDMRRNHRQRIGVSKRSSMSRSISGQAAVLTLTIMPSVSRLVGDVVVVCHRDCG
jgi:hypothetical protein